VHAYVGVPEQPAVVPAVQSGQRAVLPQYALPHDEHDAVPWQVPVPPSCVQPGQLPHDVLHG
jgi:hypothetical protein